MGEKAHRVKRLLLLWTNHPLPKDSEVEEVEDLRVFPRVARDPRKVDEGVASHEVNNR